MNNNNTDHKDFFTENNLEKKLFSYIEYFPAGVLLINENLVITDINRNLLSLIGIYRENIVGKNINEIIAESSSKEFIELLNKSFKTSIPYTMELKIKLSNVEYLNVLSMFRTFNDPDTQKKFCVCAILDFTPQKMKEEIIRDSEARFKNMANTAPAMIWISDVEGLFSFVNNVWLEYTGGELGNQLGMNWLNYVHPQDLQKLLFDYQNALKNKEPFSMEFRFKNYIGNYKWMLITGKPRYSYENIYMGFIGSCINIQEQKDNEVKISNLNAELEQTISTKDKLFSIISHDLRSPIGGLVGIMDILNSTYDSLDEDEKMEIISTASSISKNTYSLIENLLEWSRIQTGKIKYRPENVHILTLVDKIVSLYEQNLKNKEIKLISDISSDLSVFADKSMTETILRNLISNAIKFSYPSSMILISSEISDTMMVIKVKDSGIGIDQENIPNLFRIDLNFSTKGTSKESGTGLGLIICKELIEKQGGRIWVESKKK